MENATGSPLRSVLVAALLSCAMAVLGSAVAESQIIVICGIYSNSHAGGNVCHGTGPGCMECTIIMYATGGAGDAGAPSETLRREATAASSTPLLHRDEGPGQPVGLAVGTGLLHSPLTEPICESPSLYDRVRRAGLERVPTVGEDRFQSRREQAPAP